MAQTVKKWEDLTLADDFMFGKVMTDPALCKELLERILNVEISRIEYPEKQKVFDTWYDSKGIRLDVYVKDGKNTVYDIEMQTSNNDSIPKRSRYYQGIMDVDSLLSGRKYRELPKSYVIFICTFDPFGSNQCVYTFENKCIEDSDLSLGDETQKIFLYTKGKGNCSEKIKNFCIYINNDKFADEDDPFIKALKEAVVKAKANKDWRDDYMYMLAHMQDAEEKGRIEGRAEGRIEGLAEGRILNLCQALNGGIAESVVRKVFDASDEEIVKAKALKL